MTEKFFTKTGVPSFFSKSLSDIFLFSILLERYNELKCILSVINYRTISNVSGRVSVDNNMILVTLWRCNIS